MTEKEKKKERFGNEFGISGFTLGIVGIVLAGWLGLIISVIAIIFCFVQQKKKKIRIARVGLILGIIGFVLSVAWIFLSPILAERLIGSFPA